jgi:hypothetical protein
LTEELSKNMNNEVDINVLVTLYNQKLGTLANQNLLLEAKLQSLTKSYEIERQNLLDQISQLNSMVASSKSKSTKKIEDYQNSEVE